MTEIIDIEQLKYPIGKFVTPEVVDERVINECITILEQLPFALRNAIKNLSKEQLLTPYRDGGWTIAQVVHHLADAHINAYSRTKLALTEEMPTIKPYEENKWAQLIDAQDINVQFSINLIEGLHARWTRLLESLLEEELNREFFHPENKNNMSINHLLLFYSWESKHHVAQILSLRKRMKW